MLTKAQESLIKRLHTKKGRRENNLLLVEGEIPVAEAKEYIEWTFTGNDSFKFETLVTTEHPQPIAAVARIPEWTLDDIQNQSVVVVLDGVQDPGNVGTLLRLALAFDGAVVAIESADITSSKVVRASSGALFHVPWMSMTRGKAVEFIAALERPVYRIEKRPESVALQQATIASRPVIILGSEGHGITLDVTGTSLVIEHNDTLESLNVTHAAAIALYSIFTR